MFVKTYGYSKQKRPAKIPRGITMVSPLQSKVEQNLPETNSFIVATKIGGKRKIKSVPFCRIRHDHSVEARPPIP